jgi:hypothetical protein
MGLCYLVCCGYRSSAGGVRMDRCVTIPDLNELAVLRKALHVHGLTGPKHGLPKVIGDLLLDADAAIERLTAERGAARASLGAMQNTAITLRADLAAAREALQGICDTHAESKTSVKKTYYAWFMVAETLSNFARKALSTGNQEGGA